MNVLSSLAPTFGFQLGVRVLSRQSERLICASARQLSTNSRSFISGRCSNYNSIGEVSSPSRALRNSRLPSHPLLPRTTIRTAFKFRAITHYTKLPDAYEDATGLPFRKEDLSKREVDEIFGRHLVANDANRLLRIIHGRRVAGSLDDPDLQHSTAQFRAADKIKALEYLRRNIPVDEIINAGLRAEDELRMIEEHEQERAELERAQAEQEPDELLEKKEQSEKASPRASPSTQPAEPEPVFADGRLPRQPESDSPYGEGAFDRIRKRNQAIAKAEDKRLEEERIKREQEESQNTGTLTTERAAPREMSPFVKKHYERATSDLEAPPEMTAWQRLLPYVAMSVLVVGGCVAFAAFYTPPRRDWRLWPDIPPAAATCLGLILVNLAVCLLWKFPPMWAIFNRYMLVVPATPRPFQLVGAIFSHHTWSHVAMNMVALWFFGSRLHDEVGRGNFLALYLASGAIGFLASATRLVLIGGLEYSTLGASGAIYGVMTAYFWKHKSDEFRIFGLPPEPISAPQGLAFLGILAGLHIYGLFSRSSSARNLDLWSHMGGMLAGGVGMHLIQKRVDNQARIRAEKMKSIGILDRVSEPSEKNPEGPGKEEPKPVGLLDKLMSRQ